MRHSPAMRRIVLPALTYLAVILLLGFALGTVRTLWLASRTGPLLAVALELPLLLTASARLAATLVRRHALSPRSAAAMGLIAFALLMLAERGLSAAFGQSAAAWLAALATPAGLLGLAGQAVFGALPALIAVRQQGRA